MQCNAIVLYCVDGVRTHAALIHSPKDVAAARGGEQDVPVVVLLGPSFQAPPFAFAALVVAGGGKKGHHNGREMGSNDLRRLRLQLQLQLQLHMLQEALRRGYITISSLAIAIVLWLGEPLDLFALLGGQVGIGKDRAGGIGQPDSAGRNR